MLIDMSSRKHSQGKHSLDDLMRYLYEMYYEELDRGYRDEEFKEAVEKFAGNMDDFFDKYVYGTEPIPYNRFFDAGGAILVIRLPRADQAHLMASFQVPAKGLVVTRVVSGTLA